MQYLTSDTTIVDRRRYNNESHGGGILRHRHSTSSSSRSPNEIAYTSEYKPPGRDDFRSPNQEFVEYLLSFILRKIALLFYMVYAIIDSLLHRIALFFLINQNPEDKSCYRSRTVSSSPALLDSPNSWYREELRKEEGENEWGHFTFIE
jgi:hypothetical protein